MAVITSVENSIHPLTVEAYHLLYEKGLVQEKAELIEGVIYNKMPKNPIHAEVLRRLVSLIYKISLGNCIISSENPLTLGDSEPEPDISILPPGDYSQNHPTTALLVVEVSNTSLSFDRKKASVYAKGNIPEYIILNLIDKKIEYYRLPKEGSYTEIRILSHDEKFLSTVIDSLSFSLDELL